MTFDPAWFAAVVSVGALVVLAFSNSNLQLRVYKVETKLREHETWILELAKGRDDGTLPNVFIARAGESIDAGMAVTLSPPPGTRMPEMDERKS